MDISTEVTQERAQKRILYVITKAYWGGAQRYVFDLALASKNAGHEVLVVFGTEGVLIEKLREYHIPTRAISNLQRDISLMREFRSFQSLLRIVAEFQPDVIHGNSSKAGGMAVLAGRLQRVPRIVFTSHGWAFNEQRPLWQKVVIGIFHYFTVLLSHVTICVSHALQKDAHWMPFVAKRFHVIHNGIADITLLSREEARKKLAPTATATTWIGTIAELHRTKGLDVLIDAFALFAKEDPSSTLIIMGEGQERDRLVTRIAAHGLSERIVLTGFVKDAQTYLTALDVFVLPSFSEALGYVLLEAGLASLPAIGSSVGGIPEILEDNVTGLLVPPGDPRALASVLAKVVADQEIQERLGSELNKKVLSEFSTQTMVQNTLALYNAS